MDKKRLARVEIKDADRGEVEAVFSTLNAIDADGDVTLPGAFTDGAPVRISAYGHESWFGALPVGKGAIRATSTEAVLTGSFFMRSSAGRDTFEVVKEMGDLQEWSYGFDIIDSAPGEHEGQKVRFLKKLKVHEVSPVLLGAGVGTRTLAVKGDASKARFSEHASSVLAEVAQLNKRAAEVMALRAAKGKALSPASSDLLGSIESELKQLQEMLSAPQESDARDALAREYARFIALTRGVEP